MSENPFKKRRDELKLTQKQAAERLGTTEMTVSRWERGKYLPRQKFWRKIEEEFGLKPSQLMAHAEENSA